MATAENTTFAHIQAKDFEHFTQTTKEPAVIFFHKNTCQPCKSFHSVFESIAARWYRKLAFYKFDSLAGPEIAMENVGNTHPTVIIFDGGVPFAKHIGATSSEYFERFISQRWEQLQKKKQMAITRPPLYQRPSASTVVIQPLTPPQLTKTPMPEIPLKVAPK